MKIVSLLLTAALVADSGSVGIGPMFTGPTSLIIACGQGQVSISMETGKVTLTNCPADEGAKAFWDAVERMFPRRDAPQRREGDR